MECTICWGDPIADDEGRSLWKDLKKINDLWQYTSPVWQVSQWYQTGDPVQDPPPPIGGDDEDPYEEVPEHVKEWWVENVPDRTTLMIIGGAAAVGIFTRYALEAAGKHVGPFVGNKLIDALEEE